MTLPTYTPEALRGLLSRHKLSGSMAARLLGVDSRTIRRWTSPDAIVTHREMPVSAWWLLLLLTGEASIRQIIEASGLELAE